MNGAPMARRSPDDPLTPVGHLSRNAAFVPASWQPAPLVRDAGLQDWTAPAGYQVLDLAPTDRKTWYLPGKGRGKYEIVWLADEAQGTFIGLADKETKAVVAIYPDAVGSDYTTPVWTDPDAPFIPRQYAAALHEADYFDNNQAQDSGPTFEADREAMWRTLKDATGPVQGGRWLEATDAEIQRAGRAVHEAYNRGWDIAFISHATLSTGDDIREVLGLQGGQVDDRCRAVLGAGSREGARRQAAFQWAKPNFGQETWQPMTAPDGVAAEDSEMKAAVGDLGVDGIVLVRSDAWNGPVVYDVIAPGMGSVGVNYQGAYKWFYGSPYTGAKTADVSYAPGTPLVTLEFFPEDGMYPGAQFVTMPVSNLHAFWALTELAGADDEKLADEWGFEQFGAHPGTITFHTASKTAMPNPVDLGVAVGDIFYSDWGYDQTNIDFYKVTRLMGASVEVVQIGKTRVDDDSGHFTQDKVVPNPDRVVGDPMVRRIKASGYAGAAFDVNSFATAFKWDGKPKYQTAAGYGH